MRTDFLIKGILKKKQCMKFVWGLENNFMVAKTNSFSTNIYHKVTFSGVFTNFENFIPISYKSNFIFTLFFRAFILCSNFELFRLEI